MSTETKERGLHFLRIMEEGKEFTAELIKENEALRHLNLKLKEELRDAQEGSRKGGLADFQAKLGTLERENADLRGRLGTLKEQIASVEAENREFADRYIRIQQQNGNLASLYVATYNLHATLKPEDVIRNVREIIINLIGSETFGIYSTDAESPALKLLAQEGLDEAKHQTLPRQGIIEEALRTGNAVTLEEAAQGEELRPIACVPLTIHGQPLGVVVIYKLLDHKDGFADIDRELLDLLAGHAATALYSSKLFSQAERKLTTLQGFLDMLRLK